MVKSPKFCPSGLYQWQRIVYMVISIFLLKLALYPYKIFGFLKYTWACQATILKLITHSACQALSPTNSGGLLVIYFDEILLNRTGILFGEGEVLRIGERK